MAKKILVVEDEILILKSIERTLQKVGYKIFKAVDKDELKTAFKNVPFDLLILDLHIKGLSTNEVINKVKKSSPGLKVLQISGSLNEGKSQYFLQKPFRIEELRKKVREILDEPS